MLTVLAAAHAPCPATAVDLLTGHWHSRRGDEHWTPIGTGIVGVALERDSFELLYLRRTPEPAYVARPGGGPTTSFPCTLSEPGGVTFEDPTHDWPQRIRYVRDAGGLSVAVGLGVRDDLHRAWRSFPPEPWAVPSTYATAPDAPAWWGDARLDPAGVAALDLTFVSTARASSGPLVMAAGTASRDGAEAPFSAVWRVEGDEVVLVGFAAWP